MRRRSQVTFRVDKVKRWQRRCRRLKAVDSRASKDVWIDAALRELEEAKQRIQEVSTRSAFEVRYDKKIEAVDFESCTDVLNQVEIQELMRRGW